MNYSAQQILFVYKKEKKEINKLISKLKHTKCKQAYGNFYFNVDEIFSETGTKNLKYNYVGCGNVCFLGNIKGKTAGELYYKNKFIKKEVEMMAKSLSIIFNNVRKIINYIENQHGRPIPQHAILNIMADK